ncbi:MAG TPA: hypothetical protein VHM65_00835, partial [Candidatus Lustribacter sp.]|nr:hypothetical protein [Candidatus Lustribacter sp.]
MRAAPVTTAGTAACDNGGDRSLVFTTPFPSAWGASATDASSGRSVWQYGEPVAAHAARRPSHDLTGA